MEFLSRLSPDLAALDWAILFGYFAFAVAVGVVFARRASRNADEFFLSGRNLPWWLAGTSMVATTFASDTPLVVTGWVRDKGIWENWQWWCFAFSGVLTIFVFARYWRRGRVMTTAELVELRYGGSGAKVLRGFLGLYQAGLTNTIILTWVLLAAGKIMGVLFEVDEVTAMAVACGLALFYSLLAGFWGVVVTDLVQFMMAMVGSVALAWFAWDAINGNEGIAAALATEGSGLTRENLAFFPTGGLELSFPNLLDPAFWTIPIASVAVFLGVQWWASEYADGGMIAVQRISACKNEREGMLAYIWHSVAFYALRPWPWIVVAVASLIILPHREVTAPVSGIVTHYDAQQAELRLDPDGGGETLVIDLRAPAEGAEPDEDWYPTVLEVETASTGIGRGRVEAGDVLVKTDSERAYVVMLKRLLPTGLLGLAIAALLAAFMSTVDTHTNLAASFFVNDVYRRYLVRRAHASHYVWVGRFATAAVLGVAAVFAMQADSISDLFKFFLSFVAGIGPVYILRWLWWRVRAATEVVAMVASSLTTIWLTFPDRIAGWVAETFGLNALQEAAAFEWYLGPLSPGGQLSTEGRLLIVVGVSLVCSLLTLVLLPKPKPERLVGFYRRVRPVGMWGPVARLCPEVQRPREGWAMLIGAGGALLMIYGLLFGIGAVLFREMPFVIVCMLAAWIGREIMGWGLGKLRETTDEEPPLGAYGTALQIPEGAWDVHSPIKGEQDLP